MYPRSEIQCQAKKFQSHFRVLNAKEEIAADRPNLGKFFRVFRGPDIILLTLNRDSILGAILTSAILNRRTEVVGTRRGLLDVPFIDGACIERFSI